MPLEQPEVFLESVKPWLEFQKDLRDEAGLREISYELYPELNTAASADKGAELGRDGTPATEGGTNRRRTELHTVARMLQILENAWFGLELGGRGDLPLNRGWLSVFRRWTTTEVVRRYWPVLRNEYSEGFVRFCETQMRLRADPRKVAVKDFEESFRRTVY